jgi:hypothetical protein
MKTILSIWAVLCLLGLMTGWMWLSFRIGRECPAGAARGMANISGDQSWAADEGFPEG